MIESSFFGTNYWSGAYWGVAGSAPPTDGNFWSSSYDSSSYYGPVYWGITGGIITTAQSFREALVAKLNSITPVTSIVGSAIYSGVLPQTHDLGRDGAALTWMVVSNPRGEAIDQLDGTSSARVQLSAWSYRHSTADQIAMALVASLRKMPIGTWGDGTCQIMSVSHADESDQPEEPKAGSDQWTQQVVTEIQVKYRIPIP